MHNIEIGMTIIAKLYLHVVGNDLPTPFEVRYIDSVAENELGTVVNYSEPSLYPFDSAANVFPYNVEESVADIEAAIKEACDYKDAAIEKINSMLDS